MSTPDAIKEIRVNPSQDAKQVMYLTKEFLLNNNVVDLASGTQGAPVATRAADTLVRLNYVTYESVRTETTVINDRRRTRLVIRLRKGKDFQKLYAENEERRKKNEEERKKRDEERTKRTEVKN
jgi:hypothetical protein